jgi:hypothetical protein
MKYKLSDDVGSTLALVARIRAVGSVIALFVAVVIMLVVGIVTIRDKHTLAVVTTVQTVECKQLGNQSSCAVQLEYVVDKKTYSHLTTVLLPSSIKEGENLTVYVDPKNPDDLRAVPASHGFGWALIGFAAVLAILFGINAYFLFTSKTYAEVVGGVELARSVL